MGCCWCIALMDFGFAPKKGGFDSHGREDAYAWLGK
jgi:hypothetical protein